MGEGVTGFEPGRPMSQPNVSNHLATTATSERIVCAHSLFKKVQQAMRNNKKNSPSNNQY